MSLKKELVREKAEFGIDEDWIELLQTAQKIGLSIEDIRRFLLHNQKHFRL